MSNWTLGPEFARLFGEPNRPSVPRGTPGAPRQPRSAGGRFCHAYDRCQNATCTTPTLPHAGHGYCRRCYWLRQRGRR